MASKRKSSYEVMKEYGIKPPSRSRVIRDILNCTCYNVKILACLLYLTAGRITEVLNIKTKDIEIEKDEAGFEYLNVKLMNEKNKTYKVKTTTSPIKYEKPLIDLVLNHCRDIPHEDNVCPFNTRSWAYIQLKKFLPDYHFNHFFRALRLTNLVIDYNYQEIDLMNFAGWSDSRPFKHYQMYRSTKKFMELMK